VLNFLTSNPPPSDPTHRTAVLSIAPQSLASLAATLSSSSDSTIHLSEVLTRVNIFAKEHLGFERVYDTTFARHLSLLEHIREFEERRSAVSNTGTAPTSKSMPDEGNENHKDSTCCNKHSTGGGSCGKEEVNEGDGDGRLPMLASACPGWVCYAEKTHGEMLPFISRTKSPQAVMGTLVKGWLARKWGKRPQDIYHVTVMPCYDKKLEASRPDFYDEAADSKDVDCVLTTSELALLMREKYFDLSAPVPSSPPSTPKGDDLPTLISHPGSSSGSYLSAIISHLMRSSSVPLALSTASASATSKQNADSTEYVLTAPDGSIAFRGATCYGFRNLQNIVRRVARDAGIRVVRGRAAGSTRRGAAANQKAYDYVEVMACPGGCVNGGGQLPRPETVEVQADTRANDGDGGMGSRWADRAWTREVERAYWDGQEALGSRFGLQTPPASPKSTVAKIRAPVCDDCEHDHDAREQDKCAVDARSVAHTHADAIAARIVGELCQTTIAKWEDKMDDHGEALRRKLFRTSYRAVQSEVVGLGVKW